jgi:hypothetical protein
MRRWLVPAGDYAGKPVLVSVVTDFKKQPVQDRQFVSAPLPVRDPAQKFREEIMADEATVKAVVAVPEKWNGAVETAGDARIIKTAGTRSSADVFKIDPTAVYRLSGQFKTDGESGPARVFFGLAPLDGERRPILPIQVNPVPGTETELAEDAAAGTTEITVKDAAGWKTGKYLGVAFGADPDMADLPNRDIADIAEVEGRRITLGKPLKQPCPAGTRVRQHQSGNTYIYVASPEVTPGEWARVEGEVSGESLSGLAAGQWWRGSRQGRIIMVTTRPGVMFREIRLEEIE